MANSHNQRFAAARTKSSQCIVSSPVVAWYRLPTGTVPVPQLPASNSNGSQRLNRSNPLISSLTNQLTPLHSTALHSINELNSVGRVTVSERTIQKTPLPTVPALLLAGCCLATAVVSLFVSRSLPNKGSICHNIKLDLNKQNTNPSVSIESAGIFWQAERLLASQEDLSPYSCVLIGQSEYTMGWTTKNSEFYSRQRHSFQCSVVMKNAWSYTPAP
jgi:hypothetical protein